MRVGHKLEETKLPTPEHNGFHLAGGRLLHGWQHVGVGVVGLNDGGMAHTLLHDLTIFAVLKKQGGHCVSQAVDVEVVRQASLLQDGFEDPPGDVTVCQEVAVLVGEDKVQFAIPFRSA
jgi:hypothetical protein